MFAKFEKIWKVLSVFQVWYLYLNAGSGVAGSGKKTTSSKCKNTVIYYCVEFASKTSGWDIFI